VKRLLVISVALVSHQALSARPTYLFSIRSSLAGDGLDRP